MKSKRLEYLYRKNLTNTCTEDEYLEFCALVDDEANFTTLQELADAAWDNEPGDYTLADEKAKAIFNSVLQKANAGEINAQPKSGMGWYRWAAALLALICVGVAILKFQKKTDTKVAAIIEARAAKDHQLIKLADGSTVVLNANSFLKYPQIFGNTTREVTLIGEGYFDIKHDAAHPFIVRTQKLSVTVLGTAFNIKAYEKEPNIVVTVTRGKVSVSNSVKVLGVITPNQQLSFNKNDDKAEQSLVNSKKIIEWQSKDLFFNDITMEQAAINLEQRFDVKIDFASGAVKNCRFTGTFLHGESIADILRVICDFNNASFKTTTDGHIIISGPGCS